MMTTEWIRHECKPLEEHYWEAHHASGLTVLVSPKRFSTYHATLGVRYGSTDRLSGGRFPMGMAHFLEHKMFERAGGSFDDDFAALGAEVNAYTSYDRTAYLFSCTDRFPEALSLLLSLVTEFSVSRASVSRERSIIAEEIRMNADDPWERCYAEMLRALYHRHPVREEICGTESSIRRINPTILQAVFETFYHPANMVLAVSGDTTPEEVMAVVDCAFPVRGGRSIPPIPRLSVASLKEPLGVSSARVDVTMPAAKPLFCIGVKMPEPPTGAKALLRCDLGMTILSEMLFSHSGDFYNSLFESGMISPGMSYGSSIGEGYGYYAISGECDHPEAVFDAFRAYIDRLHDEGLPRREFDRARRILYADYVTGFDSTEDIAASLSGYALDSLEDTERIGLYDFLSVADAITPEEVMALFEAAFRPSQYTLSTVRPREGNTKEE